MKRLIIGSFSLLVASAIAAPAIRAQENLYHASEQRHAATAVNQITPFNLAYLAYRGELRNQGIPGYSGLVSAYQDGRVSAESLVQTAITTNLLSENALNDEGYINAVDAQLRDFQNVGS